MKIKTFSLVKIFLVSLFLLISVGVKPANASWGPRTECGGAYCYLPDSSDQYLSDGWQACVGNNGGDYATSSCCVPLCYSRLSCVNQCAGYTDGQICNKGSNASGYCGIGYCGSQQSGCCTSSYNNWTKYQMACVVDASYAAGPFCKATWVVAGTVCSTSDKCIPGEHGLRAAYCGCGSYSSSIYKECCDNVTGQLTSLGCAKDTSGAQDGYYPDEGVCPSGTHSTSPGGHCCSPNCNDSGNYDEGPYHPGKCGQGCTGTRPVAGTCGNLNNQLISSTAQFASGLCGGDVGPVNWSDSIAGDGDYNWTCGNVPSGPCTAYRVDCAKSGVLTEAEMTANLCLAGHGYAGWVDQTGATTGYREWYCMDNPDRNADPYKHLCQGVPIDDPPTLSSATLYNSTNTQVNPEGSGRNQICQSNFGGIKTIKWTIAAADGQGTNDVGNIWLRFNPVSGGTVYTTPAVAANSSGMSSFTMDTTNMNTGMYNVEVLIGDKSSPPAGSSYPNVSGGFDRGWLPTGRTFKVWNCIVPVSGTIYDGSADNSCPTSGFSKVIDPIAANFKTIGFRNWANANDVIFPTVTGTTFRAPNSFVWGANKNYAVDFNGDITVNPNTITTMTSNSISFSCSQSVGSFIIENVIDPYENDVSLGANFSMVVDQEAWFQSMNGDVLAGNNFANRVPVTCKNSCIPRTALDQSVSYGLISSRIGNTSPSDGTSNFILGKNLAVNKYNYDYFYQQYFVNRGVGTTFNSGDSNKNWSWKNDIKGKIGASGIALINGNLAIDEAITNGSNGTNFLMLVTKGNIVINPDVDQVDGILLGNNVTAGGQGNELVINGMVHGVAAINLTRSFTLKRDNNLSPAVVVNYQPNLLFGIPKEVGKKITRWKTN